MKLELKRPLAFFDIESTGVNTKVDRLIDLAIVKICPDGRRENFCFRVNPERPIPKSTTAIHGIKDEDVKDSPPFRNVAAQILECFDGCDLAGYGILQFDIPLLEEEFKRANMHFDVNGRCVIDAQRIFHVNEPRDLTAALSFYCNETHENAHSALGDVDATIRVVEGQYNMYYDLPTDPQVLSDYCNPTHPAWVDRTGRLIWSDEDEILINFGKNQGRKLKDVIKNDRSFIDWVLRKDFPRDCQDIIRDALEGKYPTRAYKTR